MTQLQFGTRREFLKNGGTALAGKRNAFSFPNGEI
jgi:hypothetical protein